jgi:Lipocalin-like domain
MRSFIFVLLCGFVTVLGRPDFALPASGSPQEQQSGSLADRLEGTWRLVSVETIRPNGEVIYPFYGKHPEGLLIYGQSGWMSVQIVSDPKPSVPTTSSREVFLAAAPAEKIAAIDGFYAYYGTWSVDPSASTVTHHIQQSLYPGERGQEGVRKLQLEASRLTLTAKAHEMGEDHQRKLVWERVR